MRIAQYPQRGRTALFQPQHVHGALHSLLFIFLRLCTCRCKYSKNIMTILNYLDAYPLCRSSQGERYSRYITVQVVAAQVSHAISLSAPNPWMSIICSITLLRILLTV